MYRHKYFISVLGQYFNSHANQRKRLKIFFDFVESRINKVLEHKQTNKHVQIPKLSKLMPNPVRFLAGTLGLQDMSIPGNQALRSEKADLVSAAGPSISSGPRHDPKARFWHERMHEKD